MSVRDVATGDEMFGVEGHVQAVDWSPDSSLLAVATRGRRSIGVLDRSGREVDTLQQERGFNTLVVQFSPDGRWLATLGYAGTDVEANYRLRIWDRERGVVVTTIPGVNAEVLAFDASGTRIATSGEELWDTRSGELITKLTAVPADIFGLAFSPDGSRLAVGSADEKVRLFDTGSGQEVLVLSGHQAPVGRMAFSPDGSMLASQDSDGVVRVWALDIDDLLELAQAEVPRSLTDMECRQFLHLERCSQS